MICWYGTGRTAWEWSLRIISTVMLWGLVISSGVALRRYLTGAQRPTDLPAQTPTSKRVGIKQPVTNEIDKPDSRQRLKLFDVINTAARPATRPTPKTVFAPALVAVRAVEAEITAARAARARDQMLANRTEQHAGEPAMSPTAHHEQLKVANGVK